MLTVLFFIVVRIAAAVIEALLPTLKDMRSDLNSIRDTVDLLNETIRCVNETVKTLAGEFEEHKDELADTQSSIQSIIDNPPTDEISRRVLQLLLPYLNNIEEAIKTDIGQLISETATSTEIIILRDELMEYKNQTTSDLTDLQSSINANLSCDKTDLANLQSSVDSVNDTLNQINNTNTDQLMQLCVKMDTLQEELHSIDKRINNNITQVNTTLSSELVNTNLGSMNKLFSDNLFSDDFNDVKTELNGINDTTNEIVDEIEDHDKQTGTKLMDIESLICDSHDVDCCGGTGGWKRVVYLDMTDPNTNCPSGWNMTNYTIRTCGRASDGSNTCDSVFFPVSGGEYSQVCGKLKAYQWGWTAGFLGYNNRGQTAIDHAYLSGVAVMHGSPRQHIWSFVAGALEHYTSNYVELCPCDTYNIAIPSFVGDDYFCESGYIWPGFFNSSELYSFHSDDPLWDGDGCHSNSTCCTFNNPPYFTKYLDNPTTDDIELRLCCYYASYWENIAVELVEIYVK